MALHKDPTFSLKIKNLKVMRWVSNIGQVKWLKIETEEIVFFCDNKVLPCHTIVNILFSSGGTL